MAPASLAPFSAFTPHDQWLYAVKVGHDRRNATVLSRCLPSAPLGRPMRSSIATGLGVGVLWIASDPGMGGIACHIHGSFATRVKAPFDRQNMLPGDLKTGMLGWVLEPRRLC